MLKILKRLNILLDKKQKKKMVLIVFLMLIGGVLESLSISAIVPVMTVLLDPNAVTENKYLAAVYNGLHMSSPTQFALVMMVVLVMAFVLKNLFLFIQNVIQLKFVYTNQFATSRRMMINFMKRPYEYYLGAETAV
ncbi:MAG: ABC transporter ATP-binding protein, partial [Lachnospiraceae bacterium]|nr:ABC transporter ATP-binding protein [Lachnospiraceae bacterium]